MLTGKLDAETSKWMSMPRCGVVDRVGPGASARKKRYALQGNLRNPFTGQNYQQSLRQVTTLRQRERKREWSRCWQRRKFARRACDNIYMVGWPFGRNLIFRLNEQVNFESLFRFHFRCGNALILRTSRVVPLHVISQLLCESEVYSNEFIAS